MSTKMGRPLSEDGPRDKLLQVRMDEKTLAKLDRCAAKLETTRSHAVRIAINRLEAYVEDIFGPQQ